MPWDKEPPNKDPNKTDSPWDAQKKSNPNNDLDQLFKKSQEKFKAFKFSNKPNNNGSYILYIIFAVFGIWLLTGFYIIDEGEQAIVQRFGKFVRIANPGPNYHLPHPIEYADKYNVGKIEKVEVGFSSSGVYQTQSNKRSQHYTYIPEESLMLTGDENIVDINFTVQWKIGNIKEFAFNVAKVRETVKSAAESAMREVIGNTPIAAAQTEGQFVVEQSAKQLLQSTLDSYNSGVEITNLKLHKVYPPAEVIDAFRDVQTAKADKEREINQAQAYQNDIIPRARGESSRIVQEAEGYKQEVISLSTGEVSRFNAIFEQYKNAKNITRRRIFLETMEYILQGMDKIIIDPQVEKSVLPYLPLPQLKFNKAVPK